MRFLAQRLIFAVLLCSCGITAQAGIQIRPDDVHLQYAGRVDFSDPVAPQVSWPGTSVTANFTGTALSVTLDDQRGRNSFNVFLDGDLAHPVVIHCAAGEKSYVVTDQLTPGPHQFLLTKRTEGEEGNTTIKGFVLADGASLLAPPARPPHRMEIFGDSISSGMGNEAADGTPDSNPREKNNFLAYGPIAARDLNCELHVISQSGIGVMISWFDFIMPQFYGQLSAAGRNDSRWDFTRWTPEVVLINLLQNDAWLIDREHRLQPEPNEDQRVQAYVDFVQTIRSKYPQAYFICALGSMDATRPGSKWPGYVEAAVKKIKANDPRARIDTLFFDFTGYEAHPRVAQHRANAAKLVSFVREKMGW